MQNTYRHSKNVGSLSFQFSWSCHGNLVAATTGNYEKNAH